MLRSCTGLLTTALFTCTTLLVAIPLLPLALLKCLLPYKPITRVLNRALDALARGWISVNRWHQRLFTNCEIHLSGDHNLSLQHWYMMVANHQSWVDILIILRIFNGRIPYVKFFLKQSLIWIPILGVAWWALDFPFMHRHSKSQLAKDPSLKGKDMAQTRKSCEKYRENPVTIINFVEGTRNTPEKHARLNSPYRHLLAPKAGGVALALSAMSGQLDRLINVTIYYPNGAPSYWDYVCGRVKDVHVIVEERAIGSDLMGDYHEDRLFRIHFQQWINQLWQEKDDLLTLLDNQYGVKVAANKTS